MWSGINDGVGILVKEELCKKVIEVRRKSNRVMAMVLIYEEEVIRLRRSECEKDQFYNDMESE